MKKIQQATGATITKEELKKEKNIISILDFGASTNANPVHNTKAINTAIEKAYELGGGVVVIPKGDFKTYTIILKSNVNLYLEEGAIIHAARTDINYSYEKQVGEGGNYLEPEVNLYEGLQDHGHTYFANSLVYGVDIENVMIYGKGLFDGSFFDEETGLRSYVLQGGDPFDQPRRNEKGHTGEWFGNKGIALVRCNNIVLKDFSILIGGHFAIIAEGVTNMLADNILVDTTRDGFDIDCCQNVTVRNSTFNSLTDDALVMKASYGAGLYMPLKNVLIEDCVVSGYDAGSVYAKKYTKDKLIATDRCGPTGRVKLGTESTCGYDLVTIKRVKFERSRGFALEAVDISNLTNIIFTDCTMENVSSSPIFIRAGERGRFPVTGNSSEPLLVSSEENVRLDNRNWVLPNTEEYTKYPAKRYVPSYRKTKEVTVDGNSSFFIVDNSMPIRINNNNFIEENGIYYGLKYEESTSTYVKDEKNIIKKEELCLYANAVGSSQMPKVCNIEISNVTIKNADPRYPIILMGLCDSKLENISLKNISVEYRGGMKMEHAIEQRQLNTNWEYRQYETKLSVQTLPWLVNTFFLKEEGLLPRVQWNKDTNSWENAPFNIPEMPAVYPEPSNWGILPAYGLYARHIDGLHLENVTFTYKVEDERYPIVLDDVQNGTLKNILTDCKKGVENVVEVTNYYKRPTNLEYVKDYPYYTTSVSNIEIDSHLTKKQVEVKAPAPGTPKDSLYPYETVPIPENGYKFATKTEDYPLPLTVHRPFFIPIDKKKVLVNECLEFVVDYRNPAVQTATKEAESHIYNEIISRKDFVVQGLKKCEKEKLFMKQPLEGATFDEANRTFTWTPTKSGNYSVTFVLDDGVMEEEMTVSICVK